MALYCFSFLGFPYFHWICWFSTIRWIPKYCVWTFMHSMLNCLKTTPLQLGFGWFLVLWDLLFCQWWLFFHVGFIVIGIVCFIVGSHVRRIGFYCFCGHLCDWNLLFQFLGSVLCVETDFAKKELKMSSFVGVLVSDPWLQSQFTQVELRTLKSRVSV